MYWPMCVEVHSGAFVAHKSDFVRADCKMSLCGSSHMEGYSAFNSFGICYIASCLACSPT